MIQLNLLPDVKMEYIKAQRQQRLVISASVLVTAAAILLLVALLVVGGLQKKHLSDLDNDIKAKSAELQGKPDINKILTVQNQLQSLTALHEKKPAAARTFDFLNSLTPPQISISSFNLDYVNQTIEISGGADALSSVNQYIDTIKFTDFTTAKNKTAAKAFSNVVLTSFGLASGDQGSNANYTITLGYNPVIFDIKEEVQLTVPKRTTTRATLTNESDLFQGGGAQ